MEPWLLKGMFKVKKKIISLLKYIAFRTVAKRKT